VQPDTPLTSTLRTALLTLVATAALLAGCAAPPRTDPAATAAGPSGVPARAAKGAPAPSASAAPTSTGTRPMIVQPSTPLPRTVALVLPLTGRMAAAGTALRDGFMTAWLGADEASRPEVRVYDAGPGADAAYRRAVAEGAGFVVGPLAKEDVQTVARLAAANGGTVGTLALNALPDGEPVPPRFHQFALAPEDDARLVAERLVAEGKRLGVALVPSGEWGYRVVGAFAQALDAGGGAVVARQTYGTQTMDYSDVINALLGFDDSRRRHRQLVSTLGQPLEFSPRRREDVQFIFVAAQPTQGRLIRPQLKFHYAGDLPVYATSDVYDPNPTANEDLEGVVFPDAPWMVSTDTAVENLRQQMNEAFGVQNVRRRGRLYAMGYDAYVLATALGRPGAGAGSLGTVPLDGMTGRLTLDPTGRVRRSLDWAAIGPDGQPRPLAPTSSVSPIAPSTP
jgi:outer membrane PBP1 activator LpoA protein